MDFNAYILDWTMNDYPRLKRELTDAHFVFENAESAENIRVVIPFERLGEASALIQAHLNAPYNYVDVQFPALKKTVIVFQQQRFTISSREESEKAKQCAIAEGLPTEQADWATSF